MMTVQKEIQKLADRVADMLENGDTSAWQKPWRSTGNQPINMLTGQPYHGVNTLILWISAAVNNYRTHRWCTFKQKTALSEKYEADIRVIEGQKSTACFRWVTWIPKQYRKRGDVWFDSKGNAYREEEVTRWTLKTFNLFNLDQFENVPDELYPQPETTVVWTEQLQRIKDVAESSGADISHGFDRACFIPSIDKIQMPRQSSFFTEDDYASTLFHELSHWTGHESRLKRRSLMERSDASYAEEELVAEFGSAFMCAQMGILEPTARHEDYLASWAKRLRADPQILLDTAKAAEKSHEFLMAKYQAYTKQEKQA